MWINGFTLKIDQVLQLGEMRRVAGCSPHGENVGVCTIVCGADRSTVILPVYEGGVKAFQNYHDSPQIFYWVDPCLKSEAWGG